MNSDNSGPAFPVSTGDSKNGHQDSALTWQFPGMSLRDYFAAKARPALDEDGDPSLYRACLVMGELSPIACETREEKLAAMAWWIEADARIRYMHADAMLKARAA